jgi:hypothetical protein
VGLDSIFSNKEYWRLLKYPFKSPIQKMESWPTLFLKSTFLQVSYAYYCNYSVQGDFEWSYIYYNNKYEEFDWYADKFRLY